MIQKWKAKAIVQKTISFFPKKEKVNYLFQKYVTKGVFLTDEYFGFKIMHAGDHIVYFKKYAARPIGKSNVLELGTGWYPVIPIFMFLYGFKEVSSIDIQSWMTKDSQITTIEKFIEWEKQGKLEPHFSNFIPQRWQQLLDIIEHKQDYTKAKINSAILLKISIQDASSTDLPTSSFDFICSNNTFEHIPEPVLKAILIEFLRIVKKDGLMSHFVDMSDHFAHFDKSINIYNFLRYTSKKWARIDNKIQPQNRMRFKDFEALYRAINLPISEFELTKGDIQALKTIPLSADFKDYTDEELAISHVYLVSKLNG